MHRTLKVSLFFGLWFLQILLQFVVFGGPDAIVRRQVNAGLPIKARASQTCDLQDSAGRASTLLLQDFTTGSLPDLGQVGRRVCDGATAAIKHAGALGKPLDLPDGLPVQIVKMVAGGALVESSPWGVLNRIAISLPLADADSPMLTFTLGHEIGHKVLEHRAWKGLFGALAVVASSLACCILAGATVFIPKPVLARRFVASWLIVFPVAAGMLWLLSDRSVAYELEADTFGVHTLVESGLPLPMATEAVAAMIDSWRDDSAVWWRGAGAHPAPVVRAAKIRALR